MRDGDRRSVALGEVGARAERPCRCAVRTTTRTAASVAAPARPSASSSSSCAESALRLCGRVERQGADRPSLLRRAPALSSRMRSVGGRRAPGDRNYPVVTFDGDRDRRAPDLSQDVTGPLRAGDRAACRRLGGGPHLSGPRALPQAGRGRPARAGVRRGLRRHGGRPLLHGGGRRGDGADQLRRRPHGHGGADVDGHPGAGPLRIPRAQGAVPGPGHPGRAGGLHRRDRTRRRERRGRHPHPGRPRRRRVGHQRVQALHHQRHPGRLALPAGPHERRAGLPGHVAHRGPDRDRRRGRLAQAREAGHVVERHGRALASPTSGSRWPTPSARSGAASSSRWCQFQAERLITVYKQVGAIEQALERTRPTSASARPSANRSWPTSTCSSRWPSCRPATTCSSTTPAPPPTPSCGARTPPASPPSAS